MRPGPGALLDWEKVRNAKRGRALLTGPDINR